LLERLTAKAKVEAFLQVQSQHPPTQWNLRGNEAVLNKLLHKEKIPFSVNSIKIEVNLKQCSRKCLFLYFMNFSCTWGLGLRDEGSGVRKYGKGLPPFPPSSNVNHYSDLQKVKYQRPGLCRFHVPDLVMGENLVLPQSTWAKQNRYPSAGMDNSVNVKYL
jgi:hypothetical protein